jgi:hypothetical protein
MEANTMRMKRMIMTALALAAVAAGPAMAQTPGLVGEWVLDAERSQSMQDALAAARGGAGGGMVMRAGGGGGGGGGGVVMRREGPGSGIMGVLQGGERLAIELTAARVILRVDGGDPVAVPLGGTPTDVTRWQQPVRAAARLSDDGLIVETVLPDGTVVTETFSSAAGELTVELRMPLPMMVAGGQQPADAPVLSLKRVYTPRPVR